MMMNALRQYWQIERPGLLSLLSLAAYPHAEAAQRYCYDSYFFYLTRQSTTDHNRAISLVMQPLLYTLRYLTSHMQQQVTHHHAATQRVQQQHHALVQTNEWRQPHEKNHYASNSAVRNIQQAMITQNLSQQATLLFNRHYAPIRYQTQSLAIVSTQDNTMPTNTTSSAISPQPLASVTQWHNSYAMLTLQEASNFSQAAMYRQLISPQYSPMSAYTKHEFNYRQHSSGNAANEHNNIFHAAANHEAYLEAAAITENNYAAVQKPLAYKKTSSTMLTETQLLQITETVKNNLSKETSTTVASEANELIMTMGTQNYRSAFNEVLSTRELSHLASTVQKMIEKQLRRDAERRGLASC